MTTSDFIEKQKKLYKSLKPCFCPVIKEMVHFNSDGLNHLLYDKHRPRNIREKHYRSALIGYITEVVAKATKATQENYENPPCSLWILDWVEVKDESGQKQYVKVILKKEGNGNVHFWSVMQKRNNKKGNDKTKKPKT